MLLRLSCGLRKVKVIIMEKEMYFLCLKIMYCLNMLKYFKMKDFCFLQQQFLALK